MNLKISTHGVQYLLQRPLETSANVNGKTIEHQKCQLLLKIIESKRNGKTTDPELTAELHSSRGKPVLFSNVKNRLRLAWLGGCIAIKKYYLWKANKQKRLSEAKRA